MSEITQFIIGSEVACTDGVCGDLRRVVIDPVARAITHLVVEPRHRKDAGHLVPVDLVASTAKEIQLRCTKAELDALGDAEAKQFLSSGADGQLGYSQDQIHSLPYYGLATHDMGLRVDTAGPFGGIGPNSDAERVTYDRVPVGEVEIRRGEELYAVDEAVGRIEGLVIDPSDHHVTHILLQEGHLWGKKRVALPITAVERVGTIIRLNLTKDEVEALPPVDVDHPTDLGAPDAAAE